MIMKKFENKGRIGKSIRIMILGIPNVGKSSFINRIAKKECSTNRKQTGSNKTKSNG